jgi:hypothetical protein
MSWLLGSRESSLARQEEPPTMRRLPILLVVAMALHGPPARADDCPFAQYAYVRDTGQIEISTGFMDRPSDLASRIPAMEKNGFVVLESEAARTFARHERVRGHDIATTIAIAPPVGHGEGGASSNVDLRVVVDRDTVVNCPLSYAYLGLDRITIDPARRYVTLIAHERTLYFDGFEAHRVIDQDWLDQRAESTRKLLCGNSR